MFFTPNVYCSQFTCTEKEIKDFVSCLSDKHFKNPVICALPDQIKLELFAENIMKKLYRSS
jgi:hypothetical protein